jgi:hypothetical protein
MNSEKPGLLVKPIIISFILNEKPRNLKRVRTQKKKQPLPITLAVVL